MQKKITSKLIETITLPSSRRLEIWDQILPGFGIRVSKTGRKIWFCVVRVGNRNRRITLGGFPALSLASARDKAQNVMQQAQRGELDPIESTSPTLGKAMPKFIALYGRPRNRNWPEFERLLNQKYGCLFGKRLDEIRRADVVRVLDDMVASGAPGRANHALAAIKKLMNWAVDRGMIEVNPIAGVKPPTKIRPRERILTDTEIARLMDAADAEGYPFEESQRSITVIATTTKSARRLKPGLHMSKQPFAKAKLTEWQQLRERSLKSLSQAKLSDGIRDWCYRKNQPHAYSDKELRELRSILRLDPNSLSWLPTLRRLTDEFAFYIGYRCHFERIANRRNRVKSLRDRVVKPAMVLWQAMVDPKIYAELNLGFIKRDTETIAVSLAQLERDTNKYINQLQAVRHQGLSTENWLKQIHVHYVDCFCETYGLSTFDTKRMSSPKSEPTMFAEAIELLGKANFPLNTKFSGALRSHVDHRIKKLRQATKAKAEGRLEEWLRAALKSRTKS